MLPSEGVVKVLEDQSFEYREELNTDPERLQHNNLFACNERVVIMTCRTRRGIASASGSIICQMADIRSPSRSEWIAALMNPEAERRIEEHLKRSLQLRSGSCFLMGLSYIKEELHRIT